MHASWAERSVKFRSPFIRVASERLHGIVMLFRGRVARHGYTVETTTCVNRPLRAIKRQGGGCGWRGGRGRAGGLVVA